MTSVTQRLAYEITLELGTLHLSAKFPCKVGATWETSTKNIQADKKPDLVNGVAVFSEKLTSNFVFQKNPSRNLFLPSPSSLKILLYTQKGVREAGLVEFDLTAIMNKNQTEMTIELPLQKCPDKNSKVTFTIKAVFAEDVTNKPSNRVLFAEGFVPDIVRTPKLAVLPPMPILGLPLPSFTAPNIQINRTVPQTLPPDIAKREKQLLQFQNKRISVSLVECQSQMQRLKGEIRNAISDKEDLCAQIQSYDSEIYQLKSKNQQLRDMSEAYNEAQGQLITARTQLAKVFNAATEIGGPQLTDRLQSAIGINEKSGYY